MNSFANVVYAYAPKNDDELELKVGDKIEVIGFEEEGWLKGRLRGRIGVFPSNFVEFSENSLQTTQASTIISSAPPNSITNPISNKLSLFGGSKASKTSLSSNSLNSNSSNSNNINNNNNNNSNSNLNNIMNNTQDNSSVGLTTTTSATTPALASYGEDSSITSSERRPKPIRGVGLGDIFAASKTKPLVVDSTTNNIATERLSTTNLANTLQKQIPKKPPPPTPTLDNINGTNSTNQAPALPPKPANQFSPHLQHHTRSLPPTIQPQIREQARVIYAYEPSNDDELAMEVGDVIDIIDKDIEDAGWWKGELRGKIGVFPDNFVQLIELAPDQAVSSIAPLNSNQDWQHQSNKTLPSQPMTSIFNQQNSESKFKSVFAATPKGFSRELENNLEKQHNGPASFLSLKRNKLQHQQSSPGEQTTTKSNDTGKGDDVIGPLETLNTTKLNHITVNRARGPSRRPPSNILNRRNQLDYVKRESNGKDDPSLGSLPISQTSQSTTHDILSSLPSGQQSTTTTSTSTASTTATTPTPTIGSTFSSKSNDSSSASNQLIKPSLSLDNVIESPTTLAPKAGQRGSQQPSTPFDKSKTATSTPNWMLELRKAQAEKKRDSPSVNQAQDEDHQATSIPAEVPDVPILATDIVPTSTTPVIDTPVIERKSAVQSLRENFNSAPAKTINSASNTNTNNNTNTSTNTTPNTPTTGFIKKETSPNVFTELGELREELKKLREEFTGFAEVMKTELKACQSATENQKKYIKELVNNLADERKKIAAMQVEIEGNLR